MTLSISSPVRWCQWALVAAAGVCAATPASAQDVERKKTESGLEYEILEKGPGKGGSPSMGEPVTVHYTGTLEDGTKFDSSRDRGEPATFTLGRVIEGWNEGLQLMQRGDRFKFIIPAKLGYGERGSPPRIPGGATLIFDVELIDFVSMPRFKKGNPDKQTKTESGIVWEYITKGEGDGVADGAAVVMKFAFFNSEGKLLQCSEQGVRGSGQGLETISGPASGLPFPFLVEMAPLLRIGDRVRCEVPPALAFGDQARGPDLPANSTTVWELELIKVNQLPKFRNLDDSKVVKTASGLEYEVVKAGDGANPKATDTVVVHYSGWLTDGKPFDSSYGRGEPATFPLNRVIAGWTEGVQLMQPGATYLFRIPSDLGYGDRGSPPNIPGGATLVFQVELLEIK